MSGLIIPQLSELDIANFWSKVTIADKDECWIWTGSKRRRGYGRFHMTLKKRESTAFIATRISYFIKHKIDPLEKSVLHTCDNPSCVNPNHLFLGTTRENAEDMMRKGRGSKQFKSGVEHRGAKLSEIDVVTIRKSGITNAELARFYKIDQSLISRIKTRKLWKHI